MATSVKLAPELKRRLDKLAGLRKRSAHWLMKEAIQQYVEKEEARERFKQEAVSAWREYQETGQHLTLDETTRWLDSWGTEEEADVPECHE